MNHYLQIVLKMAFWFGLLQYAIWQLDKHAGWTWLGKTLSGLDVASSTRLGFFIGMIAMTIWLSQTLRWVGLTPEWADMAEHYFDVLVLGYAASKTLDFAKAKWTRPSETVINNASQIPPQEP